MSEADQPPTASPEAIESASWVRQHRALAATVLAAFVLLAALLVRATLLATENAALALERTELATQEMNAKEAAIAASHDALAQQQHAEEQARASTRVADDQRALAERMTALAAEKSALADTNRAIAERLGGTVRNFELLAAVVRHEQAIAREQDLWPPWPTKIAAMDRWLEHDAGALLGMQPQIEATVAALRAQALPGSPPQTDAQAVDAITQREPPATAQALHGGSAATLDQQRTLEFGTSPTAESRRFLHRTLVDLLQQLRRLAAEQQPSVERRLRFARMLAEFHPRQREQWQQARAAIARADGVVASALYAQQPIEIPDDGWIGLVPLGMNPVTKLWEFYDLHSAWDGQQHSTSCRSHGTNPMVRSR